MQDNRGTLAALLPECSLANRRLSMLKIHEVLRLHFELQRSKLRERVINASPTTVSDYVARAKLAGLSSRLPEGQRAKLQPNIAAEDTDYRHARWLDKALFQRLLTGQWLADLQTVLLTGPTGVGKTWLSCTLAHQACQQGYSAYYVRLPRLLDELGIGRADGRYAKLLKQLARIDVLVIDDWGLAALDDVHRRDMLEVLDDRHGVRSTIVTSQLPIDHWHTAIGDATLAAAILDRLVHNAHQLTLRFDAKKACSFDGMGRSGVEPRPHPCVATREVSSLPRNRCPVCRGTGVQFAAE